jgi:ankyrin repeat protein
MASGTSPAVKMVVVVVFGLVALGAATLARRPRGLASGGQGRGIARNEGTAQTPSASVAPRASPPEPGAKVDKAEKAPPPVDPHDPAIVDAVAAGDLARIASLHEKGVRLEGTLAIAARTGKAQVVRLLLDAGVDPHENEGSTQAPLVVGDAFPAVTKLLLERGALEPSIDDAIREPAPNAVERILAKGADANATLLDAVTEAEGEEAPRVAVVRLHVAHGARVAADTLRAAMDLGGKNRDAVLDALLSGALDRDATLGAVAHAAERRDVPTIRRFAAKGIAWSLHDPERGEPALVVGARGLDLATVRALLDAGEPVDQASADGETALVAAMRPTSVADEDRVLAVVRFLVGKGANVNKHLVSGLRPLDVADDGGWDDVGKLLVARGGKRGRKPGE